MLIDISSIAGIDGASLEFSGSVSFEDFENPVFIKGAVKNFSNQYVINIDMNTVFYAECARCLSLVKKELSFSTEEIIGSEETSEYLNVVNNTVDITEAVYINLTFALSQKFLCKDDCKGLCFVCGTNLNEKECECDREVTDPRFDVLKNLLNKRD